MAKHGHLGEFDIARGDWKSYVERAKQYFTANDVTGEAKQRAILLSACGDATYRRIKDVLHPQAPGDTSFKTIVDKMTKHFQPEPSEIVQRKRFHSRQRLPNESVNEYVTQLKHIAEHCNFGNSDRLKEMLRDRLVCGIANDKWQQRLLAEGGDLPYDKAIKLLLALEAAEKEVKDLTGEDRATVKPQPVQYVRTRRNPPKKQSADRSSPCYRCGGAHDQAKCRFRSAECHFCHKKGHIAAVCRQKAKRRSSTSGKPTHAVAETDTSEQMEYPMYTVNSPTARPMTVEVQLNDVPVTMEIDTGATLSIMSKSTYQTTWPNEADAPALQPSTTKLRTYTGESISVLGVIHISVQCVDNVAHLDLVIVEGDGPTLMGRNWLSHFPNVNLGQLHTVNADKSPNVEALLAKYDGLFQPGLGKVEGVSAKFYLKPDATPKFCRAHSVPYAIKSKIEDEIDRQVSAGILEPVTFSEWATPVVPVIKKDGSVRLCGDYKVTLNQATLTDTYPLPRIDDMLASLSGGTAFSKLDLAHAYQQIVLDDTSKKLATINTHKGLYRVDRLPFGVASAPSIFQRIMETVLQGLPSVFHTCPVLPQTLLYCQ